MKRIFIAITIVTAFTSCHDNELEKFRNESVVLRHELDSVKKYTLKEEAKKEFFGNYVNQRRSILRHGGALCISFDFKGATTVVMTNWMGLPYATSYERDGEIIRVKSNDGDFILTIKDANTLIGEGWAEGTYIKDKNISKTTEVIPDEIKFYYRLKDKKTGEIKEFEKFPENYDQFYDFIDSRQEVIKKE